MTDEQAIYLCTGNPLPQDIDLIVKSMMAEEFTVSYNSEALPSPYLPYYTDAPYD